MLPKPSPGCSLIKSQCSRAEFASERKGWFRKPATWEDGGLTSTDCLQRRGWSRGFKGGTGTWGDEGQGTHSLS